MLDSITYGNPSQSFLYTLDAPSFLDKLIPQLMKMTPPRNSSKGIKEELNIIVDKIESLRGSNDDLLKRYMFYDASITDAIGDMLLKQGFSEQDGALVDQILEDVTPLITKLKFHFQRPRPYQLAKEYKLMLFPFDSVSANSPSYPSAHVLQAKLVCYVLGNHYPEKYEWLERFSDDIMYSRIYMGLHFQSDIDYSNYIWEVIIADKEFKAKYQL